MKTICAPALLAALLVLTFASCTAPVEHRIEKNPQLFNALSEHQQAVVRRGEIEEGMSKEAVFLAWGKPDRVSDGSKMGKTYNRWSYAGYEPVFNGPYGPNYGGIGGPYMYDPYYVAAPPITYLPYEARWAEFLNGKVAGWSKTR